MSTRKQRRADALAELAAPHRKGGNITPGRMTPERRNEIADALESKAEAVQCGAYGPPDHDGDDQRWTLDLRFAARKLRAGNLDDLTASEAEEIECCSQANVTDEENKEIKAAREAAGQ